MGVVGRSAVEAAALSFEDESVRLGAMIMNPAPTMPAASKIIPIPLMIPAVATPAAARMSKTSPATPIMRNAQSSGDRVDLLTTVTLSPVCVGDRAIAVPAPGSPSISSGNSSKALPDCQDAMRLDSDPPARILHNSDDGDALTGPCDAPELASCSGIVYLRLVIGITQLTFLVEAVALTWRRDPATVPDSCFCYRSHPRRD